MIVGIGVDLVDIPRFERTLARTPRLLPRLFAPAERPLAARSLAARYAAKEALIKALGGSDGLHWTEIEVASDPAGKPEFALAGSTARTVAARGVDALHLSLSHDAGLAIAYVVAEGGGGVSGSGVAEGVSGESGSAASASATSVASAPDSVASASAASVSVASASGASDLSGGSNAALQAPAGTHSPSGQDRPAQGGAR